MSAASTTVPKPRHRDVFGVFAFQEPTLSPAVKSAPYGPDDLVTASVAAQQFGITVQAISNWVNRGHLAPADTSGRRKMYRIIDLAKAEYLTRCKAQSRR